MTARRDGEEMVETLQDKILSWDGESVVVAYDQPTETWIFIAIHNTTLGVASGGTRMKSYNSPVAGLVDALRLAEGMTYKWAGVGMSFGGGKAVLAVPDRLSTRERDGLLDRYAERLKSLKGAFQTGVDMGTNPEDMIRIGAISGHAVGVREGQSADPGPYTALGVFVGMRAALKYHFGSESFESRSVLIQGLGDVGLPLVDRLKAAGAHLFVSDIDEAVVAKTVEETGATAVAPGAVYDMPLDIYAPCAVGATLNPDTISRLKCAIVAGSANNQLESFSDAKALQDRGILYAPDYVINAGGAVAFGHIHQGERDERQLEAAVEKIETALNDIFSEADEQDDSPSRVAHRRAKRFLDEQS